MNDLIQAALFPVNLPFTVVLVGLAGYWLLVSFGIFDLDSASADGDISLVDADADADVVGHHAPLSGYFHFLNVGEVPLLVILTFFTLSMWVGGLVANQFLNSSDSLIIGLAWLIPSFAISSLVTRYATMPLRGVFRLLNAPEPTDRPLIGQTCVVRTREVTPSYGQAEVASDGAPLTIQIRTRDAETLAGGDTALIVSQSPDDGTYLVRRVTASTLDQ